MHVFTYGSLMVAAVMEAVTGHRFASRKATLHDYARFRLKNASYPGIVEMAGATTDGVLYLDVDAASIDRLDAFEGVFYQRTCVEVYTPQGERRPAETYVVVPRYQDHLSTEAWRLNHFRRDHLEAFLASYHGFSALGD